MLAGSRTAPFVVALCAALPALACASSSSTLTCGPGTQRQGDQCVPTCGHGTWFDGSRCVAHGDGGGQTSTATGAGGTGGGATTTATHGGGAATTSTTITGAGGAGGATTTGTTTTSAGGGGPTGDDGWPTRVFSPYVDATAYPTPKVGDVAAAAGLGHVVLGFVVAKGPGDCTPSWGTYYDLATGPSAWENGQEYTLYDELAELRAAGGDFAVSFGGASSVELAMACPDAASLAAAYEATVDALDVRRIDLDIEGAAIADHASVSRRNAALAILQKGKSPPRVWYTLPVLPTGLTPDGVALVDDALAQGVALAGVNVMTMDYGDAAAPSPAGKMGDYAIAAVTALKAQLAGSYAKAGQPRTDAELWAMVGATPMIGLNDVTTERFDVADATKLADFAVQTGLGAVSMWSLNRDHACPAQQSVALDCSSTPTQIDDWEFSKAFLAVGK
jgi:hypothetical protein